VRDLNYQLKQLCHRNRDGSYATQAKRMHHLMLIADQLYDLGFRGIKPRSLKQNHVDALVKDWLRQELMVGTIKNRMAVLRWWAEKADRRNVLMRVLRRSVELANCKRSFPGQALEGDFRPNCEVQHQRLHVRNQG
jgi:hypothetical protein